MTPERARLETIHAAASTIECSRCGAPPGAKCFNPRTGRTAKVPCLARIRELDHAA